MKSKFTASLKYLLLGIVAVGLLIYAFRGVNFKRIINEISHANIFWLLITTVLSVVAFISRAYRWNLLIEPLGYSPSLRRSTYALLAGYLSNLIFPRLGEVTRCGSLSRIEKIPFSSLLGTVVVERIVDVLSLLICIFITAAIEYHRLGDLLIDNIVNPLFQKFRDPFYLLLFLVGVFIVFIALILYFKSKRSKENRKSIFVLFTAQLMSGLGSISKLKKPWLFVFHSVLIWTIYYFTTYLAFFSLQSTSNLNFKAALIVLVAGGLGMSAPIQGGIGTYHLFVSQALMLYGLSREDGLAFVTLSHSFQMITTILFGVVSFLLLFLENRKIKVAAEHMKSQ
jgi:uncharacterized protein (TIRG00374 family)